MEKASKVVSSVYDPRSIGMRMIDTTLFRFISTYLYPSLQDREVRLSTTKPKVSSVLSAERAL